MKRWVRRAVLGLLVLLAIIAVLAGGAWLFISSPPGERLIRSKVIAAAGNALPGKVEIGDLDLAGTTLVLAARNAALIVLLVWSVRALLSQRHDDATRRARAGARARRTPRPEASTVRVTAR